MKMNTQSSTSANSRSGFTMIELLVVATIMIVLTAVGLASYRTVNQNARNSKRRSDLETVRQALVLYRTDQGTYPNTSSFSSMLTTISTYLNSTTIQDPQNTGTYVYRYTASGSGAGFSLCADLEPSGTDLCVTNP